MLPCQNKCVYPHFSAASLRPPANAAMETEARGGFCFFSSFVFVFTAFAFIFPHAEHDTHQRVQIFPWCLASAAHLSWFLLESAGDIQPCFHSQAADIAIISLCFSFVWLVGCRVVILNFATFFVRGMCTCFKGSVRASACVQSIFCSRLCTF